MKLKNLVQNYLDWESHFSILKSSSGHGERAKSAIVLASYLIFPIPVCAIGLNFTFNLYERVYPISKKKYADLLARINEIKSRIFPSISFSTELNSNVSSVPTVLSKNIPALPAHIGGFANGGNTCYIASALQAMRQIPIVRDRLSLDFNFVRHENESPASFELRLEIRLTLINFFNFTDQGQTVSAEKMQKLGELLHKFNPAYHNPGRGGDALEAFRYLLEVLGIQESEGGVCFAIQMTKMEHEYDLAADFLATEEEAGLDIFRPSIVCIKSDGISLFSYSPNSLIVIPATETAESCEYALVAVLYGPTKGHVITYLKDHENSSNPFLECDDGATSKRCARIPDVAKMRGLIYVKLLKTPEDLRSFG